MPAVLGRRTASKRSRVRESRTPSSRTPAACTTPVRGSSAGRPARRRASWSRSATSQSATVTRVPRPVSSATSSDTPGASGPRRLVRTRWRAPWAASERATWAPSAPVPPVIRTVSWSPQPPIPSSSPAGAPVGASSVDAVTLGASSVAAVGSGSGMRARRRAYAPEVRTAIWSSSPPRRAASRARHRASGSAGMSARPPQASGSSRATARPKPQVSAWTGEVSGSRPSTETAPRVRAHSRAPVPDRACTRSLAVARPRGTAGWSGWGRSSRASSESTPAGASPSVSGPSPGPVVRRAVRAAVSSSPVRSWRSMRRPRAARAASTSATQGSSACPEGTSTGQRPPGTVPPAPVSAVQVTR